MVFVLLPQNHYSMKIFQILFLLLAPVISFYSHSQIQEVKLEGHVKEQIHTQDKNHYFLSYTMDCERVELVENGRLKNSIKIVEKAKNEKYCGSYVKNNSIYVVYIKKTEASNILYVTELDLELNIIGNEKIAEISNYQTGKWRGRSHFNGSNSGFVLFLEYSDSKKADFMLKSFIYNAETEELLTNETSLQTKNPLTNIKIISDGNLNASLLLQSNLPDYGSRSYKTSDKYALNSYLILLNKDNELFKKSLSENNPFYRSYSHAFHNNELILSNLVFAKPSNILTGYRVTKFNLENEIAEVESELVDHSGYAVDPNWGGFLEKNKKAYEKDRNNSDSRHVEFSNVELIKSSIDNNGRLLLNTVVYVIPKGTSTPVTNTTSTIGNTPSNAGNTSARPGSAATGGVVKFFYKAQYAQIDLANMELNWWNCIKEYSGYYQTRLSELLSQEEEKYIFFCGSFNGGSFDKNDKLIPNKVLRPGPNGRIYSKIQLDINTGAYTITPISVSGSYFKYKLNSDFSFKYGDNYYMVVNPKNTPIVTKELKILKHKL